MGKVLRFTCTRYFGLQLRFNIRFNTLHAWTKILLAMFWTLEPHHAKTCLVFCFSCKWATSCIPVNPFMSTSKTSLGGPKTGHHPLRLCTFFCEKKIKVVRYSIILPSVATRVSFDQLSVLSTTLRTPLEVERI